MATDTLSGRLEKLVGAEVQAALAALEAARAEPYYDEAADRSARERYYDALDATDGEPLRAALAERLERTHDPRPAYRPMQWVYPRVDLHPDGVLRSIYSGRTFSPEELIQADAAVERARTERMLEFNLRETALGPSELRAEAAAIEEALPYNCEHVVCQSWFDEDEPMRGDIHHLFACESGCNSFRGNFPYVDFPDTQEIVRDACGRREDDGFEPGGGKGPVARATLYFLLRYPGLIGDGQRELTPDRLPMVLAWHEEDPVSDYERHRNYVAAELQGNRNPMIDHPDWASRIDFAAAWA
jgi:endonuclease G, mitochondrial